MTETKWTKGPWERMNEGDIFGPLGGDSGDGVFADESDRWQVAVVDRCLAFVDGELVELGKDCMRANAHLIAAAPDLYNALLSAEQSIAIFMGVYDHRNESGAGYILTEARAALAKARGES